LKVDRRAEAIGASSWLFSLPSYRRLLVYLFAACFAAGTVVRFVYSGDFVTAFVFGGSEGVWMLFLPALLSAALAATFLCPSDLLNGFRQLLFVSMLAAMVSSLFTLAGMVSFRAFNSEFANFVLMGNAAAVVVWFVALLLVMSVNVWKALPFAFVQPFLNVAFLFVWDKVGFFDSIMAVGSPVVAAVKIIGAAAVLLTALWMIFYLLNAPAKRNFGFSTIQAVVLFFGQWLRGSKGLEEVLAGVGERVETFLGVVAFRAKRSKKFKAAFIVPYVHFGPFGNLGGSEFPALLTAGVERRFGGKAFVFHGTVNHDFNPVYSSSVSILERGVFEAIGGESHYSDRAALLSSHAGLSSLNGISFGNGSFLLASRAPSSSEDIDLSVGTALRYKLEARGFGKSIIADAHNSITDGAMFEIGSPEYFQFESAVDALEKPDAGRLRVGAASNGLKEFTSRQGVGGAGLHVAVVEAGGGRACVVLFDGNNLQPEFRSRLLNELKPYKFDYCEVATTDTHSVNTINGTHNPVGLNADREILVRAVHECVRAALKDLEDCEASVDVTRVPLSVFGAKRQSELITAINSVISIAKIVAPVILVLSIVAAFLLLTLA